MHTYRGHGVWNRAYSPSRLLSTSQCTSAAWRIHQFHVFAATAREQHNKLALVGRRLTSGQEKLSQPARTFLCTPLISIVYSAIANCHTICLSSENILCNVAIYQELVCICIPLSSCLHATGHQVIMHMLVAIDHGTEVHRQSVPVARAGWPLTFCTAQIPELKSNRPTTMVIDKFEL